jgi:hypothetical protein
MGGIVDELQLLNVGEASLLNTPPPNSAVLPMMMQLLMVGDDPAGRCRRRGGSWCR